MGFHSTPRAGRRGGLPSNQRIRQALNNAETDSSLDFAKDGGYIAANPNAEMTIFCAEIGKMPGGMIKNPTPFLITGIDVAAPSSDL